MPPSRGTNNPHPQLAFNWISTLPTLPSPLLHYFEPKHCATPLESVIATASRRSWKLKKFQRISMILVWTWYWALSCSSNINLGGMSPAEYWLPSLFFTPTNCRRNQLGFLPPISIDAMASMWEDMSDREMCIERLTSSSLERKKYKQTRLVLNFKIKRTAACYS